MSRELCVWDTERTGIIRSGVIIRRKLGIYTALTATFHMLLINSFRSLNTLVQCSILLHSYEPGVLRIQVVSSCAIDRWNNCSDALIYLYLPSRALFLHNRTRTSTILLLLLSGVEQVLTNALLSFLLRVATNALDTCAY